MFQSSSILFFEPDLVRKLNLNHFRTSKLISPKELDLRQNQITVMIQNVPMIKTRPILKSGIIFLNL